MERRADAQGVLMVRAVPDAAPERSRPLLRSPFLTTVLGLGLTLGVGLSAGLVLWSARAPRERSRPVLAAGLAALLEPPARAERMPVVSVPCASPPEIATDLALLARTSPPLDPSRPIARERDWLAAFLELERTRPGALEARGAELLGHDGPRAERVAWLRALLQTGSPRAADWLARAVRTQATDSGPDAESVASTALELLGRAAARNEEARRALFALAFAEPGLAPALRRRAAGSYARTCDESGLLVLRPALLCEADALLIGGVRAALEERDPSTATACLLAEWPRP